MPLPTPPRIIQASRREVMGAGGVGAYPSRSIISAASPIFGQQWQIGGAYTGTFALSVPALSATTTTTLSPLTVNPGYATFTLKTAQSAIITLTYWFNGPLPTGLTFGVPQVALTFNQGSAAAQVGTNGVPFVLSAGTYVGATFNLTFRVYTTSAYGGGTVPLTVQSMLLGVTM